MSPRKVPHLLGLAVMAYLLQRPMHPYELGKQLKEHNDERSIDFRHGSLYMVVGQLARAGFIKAEGTSREGGRPERTRYSLTDTGREEIQAWLRDLVANPILEHPHFVAALSLIGALPPDVVLDLLHERLHGLSGLREESQEIIDRARENDVLPLFLVEEEYRVALIDAEAIFIERLVDQITDPVSGWYAGWAQFHADHQS